MGKPCRNKEGFRIRQGRCRTPDKDGPDLPIRLRFWSCKKAVYENHPVLHSMEAQLQSLRDQYRAQPSEQNRYAVVRHEQLLAQWAPLAFSTLETQM
jgi:hypothetical protein